jgi:transketolase
MNTKAIEAAALSVRSLSMDGVERANSGHPGLPLGCADLGALLYGEILKHNPEDPGWIDRDRFVLSAGHGSMLLYSLLHLAGYGVTLDDLKKFRQLGSLTAGHPEYGSIKGIETTTGPLGQGFSNAVGMAIGEQMLGARFNTDKRTIIDHYTYALSGDGCMMEGITSEAASLAGHLGLGKLIVFYDSNHITIDGSTSIAFTEDVKRRYEAYGWQALSGSAHDIEDIMNLVGKAKSDTSRPSLILLESTIGKGSPNMAGSHKVHGAPLGAEEIRATRKNLGIDEDAEFYVDSKAVEFFSQQRVQWKEKYDEWKAGFSAWAEENPDLKEAWNRYFSKPDLSSAKLPQFEIGEGAATRNVGGKAQNALAAVVENLVGGSADLAASNKTAMPDYGAFSKENRSGRTINFGVREHGMGGITNGLALHGGFRPFAATFLVFADYMRPSIRLAAMMKLPVVYVFTHDSIYVGEDGPTHQPVEQIESLRIIPNMHVLRPADGEETVVAWEMALERTDGPTALALTRQDLTVFHKADSDWKSKCRKGAYVAIDCDGKPDVVIVATGSEVNLALEAAEAVTDKKVRVVSMISRELFQQQDGEFREGIVPSGANVIVAEAGVSSGWGGIMSKEQNKLAIDRFGESGKAEEVAQHLGITAQRLIELVKKQ